MNPSESDRMFLLERRLQEMEAALQGERPRISTAPQAESQAFRRSSSPEPTQHTQSRSLARQGALMDIPIHRETPSQQARLNRGAIGAIDSRALVPISARYEHGLPQVQTCSQPNQGSPQSYQPFLGLQSLSPNPVSTSHVNQARRASAATMIQRRQNTRATPGSTRGTAPSRAPRGFPRAADPAQSCYTEDNRIRLQVRVYPPDVSVHPILSSYLLTFCHKKDADILDGRFPTYRLVQETVVGYMRDNYLVWDSVEERSAPLVQVFATVKAKMESSPASYRFVQQEYFLRGHEGLGLTLLEHINRGHLKNNQSALRATSYRTNTTIESLLLDKVRFAVAAHHLGFYESSFVINAGMFYHMSVAKSLDHS